MAEYLVYIETSGDATTGGSLVAHVPALPGASVRAQTIEEAKEKIQAAVRAYLSLLREAGEPVPDVRDGIHLEFEEVDGNTFLTDYDALRPNEMETFFRWMAIVRQELVDLVKDLPEETLNWKLDSDTLSIHDILCQMAEADLWHTDRLKQWPETPLLRLAATRGVALEQLRSLTETERAGLTVRDGEEWTPRKVIRRMLEYECEHLRQIREILAARQ